MNADLSKLSTVLASIGQYCTDHRGKFHQNEEMDVDCNHQFFLSKIKELIPRFADGFFDPERSTPRHVCQMCNFLIPLLSHNVCPFSDSLFDEGSVCKVGPMLFRLWQLVALPKFKDAHPALMEVALHLVSVQMQSLPLVEPERKQAARAVAEDLLVLLEDCLVLVHLNKAKSEGKIYAFHRTCKLIKKVKAKQKEQENGDQGNGHGGKGQEESEEVVPDFIKIPCDSKEHLLLCQIGTSKLLSIVMAPLAPIIAGDCISTRAVLVMASQLRMPSKSFELQHAVLEALLPLLPRLHLLQQSFMRFGVLFLELTVNVFEKAHALDSATVSKMCTLLVESFPVIFGSNTQTNTQAISQNAGFIFESLGAAARVLAPSQKEAETLVSKPSDHDFDNVNRDIRWRSPLISVTKALLSLLSGSGSANGILITEALELIIALPFRDFYVELFHYLRLGLGCYQNAATRLALAAKGQTPEPKPADAERRRLFLDHSQQNHPNSQSNSRNIFEKGKSPCPHTFRVDVDSLQSSELTMVMAVAEVVQRGITACNRLPAAEVGASDRWVELVWDLILGAGALTACFSASATLPLELRPMASDIQVALVEGLGKALKEVLRLCPTESCIRACLVVFSPNLEFLKKQHCLWRSCQSMDSNKDSSNLRDLEDIQPENSVKDWAISLITIFQECLMVCTAQLKSNKNKAEAHGTLQSDVTRLQTLWQTCSLEDACCQALQMINHDGSDWQPATESTLLLAHCTGTLSRTQSFDQAGKEESEVLPEAMEVLCCFQELMSSTLSAVQNITLLILPVLLQSLCHEERGANNCQKVMKFTIDAVLSGLISPTCDLAVLQQLSFTITDLVMLLPGSKEQSIPQLIKTRGTFAAYPSINSFSQIGEGAAASEMNLFVLFQPFFVLTSPEYPVDIRCEMIKVMCLILENSTLNELKATGIEGRKCLSKLKGLLCDENIEVCQSFAENIAVFVSPDTRVLQALYVQADPVDSDSAMEDEFEEGANPSSSVSRFIGWFTELLDAQFTEDSQLNDPDKEFRLLALVTALRSIGCCADPNQEIGRSLVLWALIKLLSVWLQNTPLKAYAGEMLVSVAEDGVLPLTSQGTHQKMTKKGLLEEHGEEIYPILIKTLIQENTVDEFFVQVLGKSDVLHFLEKSLPHVLPHLVLTQEKETLLKFAELLTVKRREVTMKEVDTDTEENSKIDVKPMNQSTSDEDMSFEKALCVEMEKQRSTICLRILMKGEEDAVNQIFTFFLQYFPDHTLGSLIWSCQMGLLLEVAREATSPDENQREAVVQALQGIAIIWQKQQWEKEKMSENSKGGSSKRKKSGRESQQRKKGKGRKGQAVVKEAEASQDSDSCVRNFVSTHFLYVMSCLTQSSGVQGQITSRAVKIVDFLLPYLDPISKFVPKIMAFLNMALSESSPELVKDACEVTARFAELVGDAQLAENLDSLVVNLIPVLVGDSQLGVNAALPPSQQASKSQTVRWKSDNVSNNGKESWSSARQEAASLLHRLIVEKRSSLKNQFGKIPFVPDLPELEAVNQVLADELGTQSFKHQLSRLTALLSHKNVKVCQAALQQLTRTLAQGKQELMPLTVGGEMADEVVNQLLRALLQVSAHSDHPMILLACGACLGELGAIDPARLNIKLISSTTWTTASMEEQLQVAPWCYDEIRMAFHLIDGYLVNLFRESYNSKDQDRIAFAIQELLKVLGSSGEENGVMSEEDRNGSQDGLPTWLRRRFADNPQTLEIVESLWHTSYQIFDREATQTKGTIFSASKSFQQWLSKWCRQLTSNSSGTFQRIFQACRGVVREEGSIALFLLPYLIQDAVSMDSEQKCQMIRDELVAVLQSKGGRGGLSGGGTLRREFLELPASSGSTEMEPQELNNLRQMAVQAVFTLLDTLTRWSSYSKSSSSQFTGFSMPSSSASPSEAEVAQMKLRDFLRCIPKWTLAQAAVTNGAYARALRYLEQHIKERQGEVSEPTFAIDCEALEEEEQTLLLQIYCKVEEPDGMAGVEAIRRVSQLSTNLTQQVLIHEHAEDWVQALHCYEQTLQQRENRMAEEGGASTEVGEHCLQTGLVRCLIQLGHYESALSQAAGALNFRGDDSQLNCELFPLAMEAAWRLQRWPLLHEMLDAYDLQTLNGAEGPALSTVDDSGSDRAGLAQVLLCLKEENREQFEATVERVTLGLMGGVSAASMESYQLAYPYLIRLHQLREVQQAVELLNTPSHKDRLDLLKNWEWDSRMEMVAPSLKHREVLTSTRRLVFQLSKMSDLVWESWLSTAKSCRKAGRYEVASWALHQASAHVAMLGLANKKSKAKESSFLTHSRLQGVVDLQEAKLLYARGQVHKAIQVLESVEVVVSEVRTKMQKGLNLVAPSERERFQYAKRLLLPTIWMQESGLKHGQQVIDRFELALHLHQKWELGHVELGKYYDFLFTRRCEESANKSEIVEDQEENLTVIEEYRLKAIFYYCKSLFYGTKHTFSSMPRMLTLFFELGLLVSNEMAALRRTGSSRSRKVQAASGRGHATRYQDELQKAIQKINGAVKEIPAYVWCSCLPQLISRVGHPNHDVVEVLVSILVNITVSHPKQAIWLVIPLGHSMNAKRREVGECIIKRARRLLRKSNRGNDADAIECADIVFREIIQLAQQQPHGVKFVKHKFRRQHEQLKAAKMIVPFQAALTVALPQGKYEQDVDPFPGATMTIFEFNEDIEVMASKARPKKLTITTNCGKELNLLCKREKDGDLRKDARVMEINGIINRLLKKDPEGRRRKLQVRTYSVICLNEECGLLEWVPNTKGLRHILLDTYNYIPNRKTPNLRELRRMYEFIQKAYDDKAKQGEEYARTFSPLFPPIMHRWFLENFPEPTSWFEARTYFTRTCALWSAVGHVLGLGDRHGENVLIDVLSGGCIHVDFDCLFDKGLALNVPEIVPFRLTPNMIDGFGITKCEGIFRRVMEITMKVLRDNKPTLLSVLEAFLQDPTVGWQRLGRAQRSDEPKLQRVPSGAHHIEDTENQEAKTALNTVKGRLEGIYNLHVRKTEKRSLQSTQTSDRRTLRDELPLSVQGQVHRLIQEATSPSNLCQMYIGWMPWM